MKGCDFIGLFDDIMSIFDREPDRTWKNSDDGQIFYGFDNEEGETSWYDKNGNIDSITPTPTEEEQAINDGWY